MEKRFEALARFVLAHRFACVAALALVLATTGFGATKLEVAFSFQSFVGSRDTAISELRDHIARWGSDDAGMFIVVKHADGVLTRERLAALEGTLKRLEDDENIAQVIGLPRIPLLEAGAAVIGAQTVEQLVDAAIDDDAAKDVRDRILKRTDIVPLLISQDGTVTTILAQLNVNADDITAYRPVVTKVRRVLDEEERRTGFTFKMAGIPAVRSEFVDQLISDQSIFMSIALVCVLLLLIALFRSVHGIAIPLVAALVPTGILFGIMGWVGEPIGILSQVYITLIPVIALADTIHVVTRYHQEVRQRAPSGKIDGPAHLEAIVTAMGHTGAACLFTSVTTMVGFFSLYVADMQVLHSFGYFAGIGVAIAFVCLLIILPIGLSLVHDVGPAPQGDNEGSRFERILGRIGGAAVTSPWVTLGITTVVCAVALGFGLQVRVDNRLNDVLGDAHDVSIANALVDGSLGGVVTIQVALRGEPGALGELATLQRIDALERELRALDDVRALRGPATALRTLNLAVTGEDRLPASKEMIAQLWLLAGEAAGISAVLHEDLDEGRIILHMPDLGGARIEVLASQIVPAVQTAFGANQEVTATITGVNWVAYKSFNRLSRELLWSLLSALGLICVLIAVLFRSVSTALLSMVPNVVPLLLTLAVMGMMGWRLDPPSSVVFVVALGIAVDDTIHLLARVREEVARLQRTGAPPSLVVAVQIAVTKSGRAIAITTALLVVGFGVNSLSSFPMNRIFGVLGAVAVFSALWCDLLVLPALLAVVERWRTRGALKTPQ